MNFDAIVIGGGAAGLFCAAEAGRRGKKILVIERNDQVGRKIVISGGGRCNFTNRSVAAENFVSNTVRQQLAGSAAEIADALETALGSTTITPALTIDLSNAQITGLLNSGSLQVSPGFVDTPGAPLPPGGGGPPSSPPGVVNNYQVVSNVNNPEVVDVSTAGAQANQNNLAIIGLLNSRPN